MDTPLSKYRLPYCARNQAAHLLGLRIWHHNFWVGVLRARHGRKGPQSQADLSRRLQQPLQLSKLQKLIRSLFTLKQSMVRQMVNPSDAKHP